MADQELGEITFAPKLDPLAKLPAIAERLGVEPRGSDSLPSLMLRLRDGRMYDAFDLINALLDKIDAANKG